VRIRKIIESTKYISNKINLKISAFLFGGITFIPYLSIVGAGAKRARVNLRGVLREPGPKCNFSDCKGTKNNRIYQTNPIEIFNENKCIFIWWYQK
jgi:hypothetical protein